MQLRFELPAILKDFTEYPYATLRLRCLWEDGVPIDDATLYIRLRMSEAWQLVANGRTTLSGAADPLPLPPVTRVVRGSVEFPAVRQRLLELTLVTDDGHTLLMTHDVDPERVNEIRVPRP